MVNAKLTTFLISTVVTTMLLFSPYRRVVIIVSFVMLVYLSLKMLVFKTVRNVPLITKEELKEKIEPGDLLQTFNVKDMDLLSPYNIVHVLSNEDQVHTLYAIEHDSSVYVLNTYTTDIFSKRKHYFKNLDSLILIKETSEVSGRLEPIDEFVRAESVSNSFVRVIKTKKKAPKLDLSQKEMLASLSEKRFVHCAMVVGKYLESQGVIENRSAYSDFLYYMPDVIRNSLGVISDQVYRIKKE